MKKIGGRVLPALPGKRIENKDRQSISALGYPRLFRDGMRGSSRSHDELEVGAVFQGMTAQ